MSNNTFSFKRFGLLVRQYLIHNKQFLLMSAGAYIGVIFIILSIVQVGNDYSPHGLDIFRGFFFGFVGVFGVLHIGHAFPAFRSKESTINYLMVPCSTFEKYLFEFISRVSIIMLILPVLYWFTFHLQGYFFELFIQPEFVPFGVGFFTDWESPIMDNFYWILMMFTFGTLLAFVIAFTGAASFMKQPLVKTLFCVALVVGVFIGYSVIMVDSLDLGSYVPSASTWLIPHDEASGFRFFAIALILANIVMLFVAYRKLKEREV